MKTTIQLASTDDFFKRGKEIAKLADQGKRIAHERIIPYSSVAG